MRLVGGFLTFAALSILCAAEDIYGTCSNYSLVGTTLSATCSRQNGSTVQTSLDLVKCIGVTTDGQLECTRNGGLTLDNCGACVVFSQSQNNVSFQCKCPNEPITYYDYTTVDLNIYFARNIKEHYAALELHDAVLRREGAFVAVSLFHVNTSPMVPYPAPMKSGFYRHRIFLLVSELGRYQSIDYLTRALSLLQVKDYGIRSAWIGPNSFPLNLTAVGMTLPTVPTQYPSLSIRKTFIDPIPSELGNSASGSDYTLEERRRIGANVERLLEGEEEAAPAPLVMFD
ncbi:hypothetical protein J3A83DRAFT_4375665 [Scleroderma citrinum]